MDTSAALVLKNFGGVPEITASAHELKLQALALARPIAKVENDSEQAVAIDALQALKAIRTGMEATRKSVKAPVLDLGKKIDTIAADFLEGCSKQEGRLQGLINHYQRKILEAQRAEEERIRREQAEAIRLEAEARRLREEAERTHDSALQDQATKIEGEALDKQMAGELSESIVVAKPKGLVVKSRLNFQIENAIVFCQAYPQFFGWNAETETLKLKRREILEELNREDGKGIFHETKFPEELPDQKGSRVVKPAGMRVYEETKSHVR